MTESLASAKEITVDVANYYILCSLLEILRDCKDTSTLPVTTGRLIDFTSKYDFSLKTIFKK